jgi:hypothetical protein
MDDEPEIELAESVGDLDQVVVTLREFLHRTGALRVVAVRPDLEWMVDVGRLLPVEVAQGERMVHLAHSQALDAEPLPLPELRQLPKFDVLPESGEVHSTIGGLEHYAEGVRELSRVLGEGAVAVASFETNTPDLPLSISARGTDPLVLAIGEDDYEMEAGWP